MSDMRSSNPDPAPPGPISLRLLGPLGLEDASGQEIRAVLRQPKRLALLAYLVLSAPGAYRRRDSIVALFWPTLDEEHARGALRRALSFLRGACGRHVLASRGEEEVGIAPGAVSCDALDFEAAARAGRDAEARALYRGDLLEGFYIDGAPNAEQWFDNERTRLRALYAALRDATPALPAPARRPRHTPPPIQRNAVAILPFVVRGGAELQYLGEGMLDLLASALDGAGDLRVIDPRATMAASLPPVGASDASEMGEIGRELGAGWLVSGTVVVAGERLRLSATLAGTRGQRAHRAEAEALSEEHLFDAVDELARGIIAGLNEGPGATPALLAARTSANWAALRSFLQGEHEFRLGNYPSAMTRFEAALERDREFSLAWYRLASSRAACATITSAREANQRALATANRLSPHAHAMLEAQDAWLNGRIEQADDLYSAIVTEHPDDVEAWYLLGDVRFHGNAYRGRPAGEARLPLQQALNLDPGNAAALAKLARLSALDGDDDLLALYVDKLQEVSPQGDQTLALRVVRTMRAGGVIETAKLALDLRGAKLRTAGMVLGHASLYGNNLGLVERVGAEVVSRLQSPELRAYGLLLLADGALAQGNWDRAAERWREARDFDYGWALAMHALRASFADFDAPGIHALREELDAWDAGAERPHLTHPLALHDGLQQHIRWFLLGILAVKEADEAAAAACQEELSELGLVDGAEAVVGQMLRLLDAERRLLRGDAAGALKALERTHHATWFQHAVASPIHAGAEARFLRGRLLAQAGRYEESLGWLDAIGESSPWELPLKGPARRRAAEIRATALPR